MTTRDKRVGELLNEGDFEGVDIDMNDPAVTNKDTFCLHFAKSSKKYHGIYEFMFHDTAIKLQSQYKYLNLEEDMGNKNLRRTKSSYGPECILKKYRVSLRTGVQ